MSALPPAPPQDTWHDSTQFQVAFLSEAVYPVTVSDLSPGSTYDIYCYVEDARGNGARAPPLTVQTTCPLGWIADRSLGARGWGAKGVEEGVPDCMGAFVVAQELPSVLGAAQRSTWVGYV